MNRDALYWAVLGVVVAASSSGLYLKYQDTRPCVHPIPYALGAVDSRFGTTRSTLLSDAQAAAAIWNKAAGKTVLVYDENSVFKINLVYDTREANAKLGAQIAAQQAERDATRATLDAMQAQFQSQQAAYNQEVSAINARGGATRSELPALTAERNALADLQSSINAQVDSYNASVRAFNAVVAEFNKTAGRTFEEGHYVQDASGKRIDIFEFVGNLQLERVLAHEFGHTIGLDHNADPKSIMYAQNESGNLVPTATDLAALKSLCGT